jgi:probable sporulation protein (polysaccharide deacetylase family)
MLKSNKKLHLKFIIFTSYLLAFTLVLSMVSTTPIQTYITALKPNSIQVDMKKDSYVQEIKKIAEQIDQPPINAKIDPIWKAIPGYNGTKVNIEKTYERAIEHGKVDKDHMVIDQIKPEKGLENLPPNPIYRGNPQKPMVSFMVNVAWGTEHVHKMLEIFDRYKINVTFYLDGSWLAKNKSLAEEMIKGGHEIGNHAYSHPDLKRMGAGRIRDEIVKTESLIQELGVKSKLFAPPSGSFDERVVKVASDLDMKVVLWTLDTVDWRKPAPQTIVNRIVPKLENGALILMHPTEPTVEALPQMIEGAINKKLFIGTTSDLLSPERPQTVVTLP